MVLPAVNLFQSEEEDEKDQTENKENIEEDLGRGKRSVVLTDQTRVGPSHFIVADLP